MRVNPKQFNNCDPVEVLGLTWLDADDRAAVRRIVPAPDALRLAHMRAKHGVADTLRAITVERAYGRLGEHAFRALVCVLADLLWPAEGETGDLS